MSNTYSTPFPPLSHIEELIGVGNPSGFGLLGTPEAQILVIPSERRLEARILEDSSEPDVSRFRFIDSRRLVDDGRSWNSLSIVWTHTAFEAYLFLCDIIDRVQAKGESLATAAEVVLQGMGSILRRQSSLTREQEIGLFGELLVLDHLLKNLNPADAIKAWRGPQSEEHDFVLGDYDLEVKTTTSDERIHWITNARQLAPAENRPLKLASVQLTPKGGSGSCTLGTLVDHLVESLGDATPSFLRILESSGYTREDADLYPTQWALRDVAACFAVDDEFPKITGDELARLPLGGGRIKALRYQINITGLPSDPDCNLTHLEIPAVRHG